jgi:TolA-binding protein
VLALTHTPSTTSEPSDLKKVKSTKTNQTKTPPTETTVPAGQNKFTYAKGLVLSKKFQEAVPLLQEVIAEEPRNGSAHRWLGDAYSALGKKTLAKEQWERFLTLSPEHPDARKVRADIDSLR